MEQENGRNSSTTTGEQENGGDGSTTEKKCNPNEKKLQAQQKLARLEDKRVIIWINILCVFIGVVVFFALLYLNYLNSIDDILVAKDYILSIVIGTLSATFLIIYTNLEIETKKVEYKRVIAERDIDGFANDKIKDAFDYSLHMSYKYLDQYYCQTREHAQKGFKAASLVSIGGAIIIAVGIISLFFGKGEAAYVTTASGIITEFISAVFFYLYNRTIQSMGAYHNKLILSQNVALAIKIADSLSNDANYSMNKIEKNDKNDAKRNIINELIKDVNNHFVEKLDNQ